jgi:hypothetical protein
VPSSIPGCAAAADVMQELTTESIKELDGLIKDVEPFVQERLEAEAPLDEFLWQRGKDRGG